MTGAPTFVLVHGGCHTASCWNQLIGALAQSGRRAMAVDLPGHGRDPVADPVPKTLDDGISAVVGAIGSIEGPVVLVGHSLGGMTISGVAEAVPERLARLVYLTAVVRGTGNRPRPSPISTGFRPVSAATSSTTAFAPE